jgi:uncharacterized protein YecT (DUF1311 family)
MSLARPASPSPAKSTDGTVGAGENALPLLKILNQRPAFASAARLTLIFLPLLLLPGSAHAQCEDKQTTMETVNCMDGEVKKTDAELNRVYQAALKKHRPENVEKLRKAQRAWIVFRDAQCTAEGSIYEGGTIQPIVEAHCRVKLTQERTKYLMAAYAIK